ncbi:BolA family protein [Pelagibius sp. CAU 1746]|uniref:BolA family protein n=1 Tax=Pelagibius sp. CAU 1746 TaxID=3140370 RepID=UPI00325B3E29
MAVAQTIEQKLTEALAPQRLKVVDDSEKHKGHAGYREGGETHFSVEVVSAAFAGQSRVARQRRVYEILAEELAAGVHALQLKTLTPEEEVGAG